MKKVLSLLLTGVVCIMALSSAEVLQERIKVYLSDGQIFEWAVQKVDSIKFSTKVVEEESKRDYIENGALVRASFKVSVARRVYFSQGNLQFNATQGTHAVLGGTKEEAGTWRFAENQYDYIGSDNSKISPTYDGWIDLFGWGTSGWNSGATAYQPWSSSENVLDYTPGGSETELNDLTGNYAKSDWGVYNAIYNGGNQPGKWRTLTSAEWNYLLQNNKWAWGWVKTSQDDPVLCCFLIPEGFSAPDGVEMNVSTSDKKDGYDAGAYTIEQFKALEKLGVVALPCGGWRMGVETGNTGSLYWSTSAFDSDLAVAFVQWLNGDTESESMERSGGGYVRLVQDLETNLVEINFKNSDGTTLLDTAVTKGDMPKYTRGVPTKEPVGDYAFEFIGWDKEFVAAEGDMVYTAVYDSSYIMKKDGVIRTAYKVSDTKKVYFSQGNLQFNAKQGTHAVRGGTEEVAGTWRFAENQYDIIGEGNAGIAEDYDGWIDLFSWATSGWAGSDATAYQPWSSSQIKDDYVGWGGQDFTYDYANADWGVYNAISNGGNTSGRWRTLANDEWIYLLENNRWTFGKIENMLCLMLIPDSFTAPEGLSVEILGENNTDKEMIGLKVPSGNSYKAEQFKKLENLGVVALPCGGIRTDSPMSVGVQGRYWSSSAFDTDRAYRLYFDSTQVELDLNFDYRYFGCSVRLVQDYKWGYVSDGALIKASYKVSDDKNVYFSQGNLQFNAMDGFHAVLDEVDDETGTWRFAENQYDYIGEANSNISSTYDGWIDLFGWGTSGWNSGAKAYQPWSTSEEYSDYYPGESSSNDLTGDYAKADWGVYNAISNGGNEPNKWRTLTTSEWQYLFKNNKWTLGYIKTSETDSSLCFFLIPDEFTAPSGVKITVISTSLSLSEGYVDGISASSYAGNTYTTEQFDTLERLGVVALPCAGYREGTSLSDVGSYGYYWSSSALNSNGASSFYFHSTGVVSSSNDSRYYGNSVRIVQDVSK